MKKIASIFILTFFVHSSYAQLTDEYWQPDSLREQDSRISTNIRMGTSVGTNFNGGTSFSSFVAPAISYRLNPRWTLDFGTAISNTNFDNWTSYQLGDFNNMYNQVVRQEMYVSASYQATENLRLIGTVYQSIWNYTGSDVNNPNLRLPGTSYSLGMEYQFNNNMSIGVEVRQSRGYSPFNSFNSPFNYGTGPFSGFGR